LGWVFGAAGFWTMEAAAMVRPALLARTADWRAGGLAGWRRGSKAVAGQIRGH